MIGQTVSHYRILEKLGEGGMGMVYKAQDTKLDRVVALKFLRFEQSTDETERARFLQEAKAASALNHPNVCGIHAIGEHEGQIFIDMEYVEGKTIREKCAARPPSANEAIEYAVQIGEALRQAHSKGIIHRDVKCDNIMVNERNEIKVMDFGLAKVRGSHTITRTTSTVGTLASMAPEQLHGGESDVRSDIFSFGIALYEMVAGRMPFRGEHEAALIYSILNEDPPAPSQVRPEVSAEIDRIVMRSLEKDPADRYQHVDDMVSELRRVRKQSTRVSRADIAAVVAQPAPGGSPTPVPAAKDPFVIRGKIAWIGAAISILIVAGVAAYLFYPKPGQEFDSLAVLPFVNTSTESNTEYLSDGITESIINSLSRIPQLRVVPRSVVFHYKGKDADPQEIGSKLGVKSILMGRVVRHGDDLNVQLDLIDVQHQSQIWGNQYHRNIADVLALQDEIVGEITQRLQLTLASETRKHVTKRSTDNVEAYQLYLQGQYRWNKRQAEDLDAAVDLFKRALVLDPNFAQAYVGLATCYAIQWQYSGKPARELFAKAEEAARKALQIDNTSAEAHTVLGFSREVEWDWKGAEDEYKTAISLNPKYATAYHWYSLLLRGLGRVKEAEETMEKARQADPMSLIIALNIAEGYRYKRDFKTAIAKMQGILELDSSFAISINRIGRCYRMQGNLEVALPYFQRGGIASHRSAQYIADEAICLALMGRREEAEAILRELRDRYDHQKASAYVIATVLAGMGKRGEAMDWLERDMDIHDGWVIYLPFDDNLDPLRGEPRFQALLKRIQPDRQ